MSVVNREGIVYVEAENELVLSPAVMGFWERGEDLRPDGQDERSTAQRYGDDLDAAIGWARQRSPRIALRMESGTYSVRTRRIGGLAVSLRAPVCRSYRHYSAGTEWFPDSTHETEQWPHGASDEETVRETGFGGVVRLVAEVDAWQSEPTDVYGVRWEVVRDEPMRSRRMVVQESASALGEDDAVTWGRERAPIVLVCVGGLTSEYYSAGEEQLAGIDIPSWDSRWDNPTQPANEQGGWVRERRRGRSFPIESDPEHDLDGLDGWSW